uniref:Uncharacterized protein LOC111103762 n=1 Tax=Crassostrea virginica TaxID=6565 RepID=A0A8B8AN21_CRAVI|nr:uncharacterized protein LOC111103762 [Crassostrea virginica]
MVHGNLRRPFALLAHQTALNQVSHVGTNSTSPMTIRGMVVLEEPDMLKKRSTPPLLMSVWSFATLLGYAREQWGEEFQLQPIAGRSRWYCNSWYECGIKIPGTPEPDCMSATPPCWYSYNVWLDNSFNGCSGGEIFVKRTNYTSAPFLAVQLCSSTRYKLFLGSSLGGKFMNIADGSGREGDHCELVGGSELTANTVMLRSLTVKGYYRHHEGEQFSLGSFSEFTSYYECGVSIPGTDIVV